jgi:tRNA modification GTPase
MHPMPGSPEPSDQGLDAATSPALEVACYRATPHGAGAVATIELIGDVSACLRALCGRDVAIGGLSLRKFDRIDEGLVARLAPERAQIMPHGGTRIVERLAEWFAAHGANWIDDLDAARATLDPLELFPEASDRVEALALATLARAASPMAVRLLLAQGPLWSAHGSEPFTDEDRARWERLSRLVQPPRVVLIGAPNAGKSTLSNVLLGQELSLTSPIPGTTRDAVSARIDLAGLVVEWFDLPGDRETTDHDERTAIELSQTLIRDADFIISLAAPGVPWIDAERAPDLHVYAKIDEEAAKTCPRRARADVAVSAKTGEGLDLLREKIRDHIVPVADRQCERPWAFDPTLLASPTVGHASADFALQSGLGGQDPHPFSER